MAPVTVKRKSRGRVQGKRKTTKVSATKLSNKRLNKLAKQGKLKKRVGGGRELQKLAGDRHIPVAQTKQVVDIPLEEADYDYYSTEQRDFSFLSNAALESSVENDKHKSQKKSASKTVKSYEKAPRGSLSAGTTTKHLLPIKSHERGLELRTMELKTGQISSDTEDATMAEEDEEEEVAPQVALPPMTAAELSERRAETLASRKHLIASLASSLLENPEKNMSKLKELVAMMREDDPCVCVTVRKLAAASLLEVFRDVIPGYRIREATLSEKEQSVTKGTVALRGYEEELLSCYKSYLTALEAFTRPDQGVGLLSKNQRQQARENAITGDAVQALRKLALRCLCELLVAHPHFNYRTNVIALVVPFMDRGGTEVAALTCEYVSRVFREDRSGEVTLEIVRLIGRLIKTRKFNVKPQVLDALLSLRIKEVQKNEEKVSKRMAKKDRYLKTSRRDRKRNKDRADLEKELQNASVAQDKRYTLRLNSEILQLVFLIYFRILKQACHSILLPSVLEGLAKFAHLISVDFFDDLFAVLNDLVGSDDLSYRESLHCVQTAFTILSGQGEALNVDPHRFYQHLYANLFHLSAGVTSEDVPIALHCLDIMIRKRRKQVSLSRLFAFVKRLSTLSLQTTSEGSLGTMAAVRTLMHADSRTDILLDTESIGGGTYLPELKTMEHCNAHASTLYELHTLRRHYHPTVRLYSQHLLAGAPSEGPAQLPPQLARQSPIETYADFDSSTMKFNPPVNAKAVGSRKQLAPPQPFIDAELFRKANECLQAIDVNLFNFHRKISM